MSARKPIKLSSEFNNIAYETIQEEISAEPSLTLKHYYQECFTQAEIDGVDKNDIVWVVKSKLNTIKWGEMKKIDKNIQQTECLINVRWYYKCAKEVGLTQPQLEVDEQKHSSLYSKVFSHTGENQKVLDVLDGTITTLKLLKTHIHTNPFTNQIPENILDDILTRMTAYNKNAIDYLNNKQTVPINAQLLFLQTFNQSLDINNLFALFFDEIKKIHILNRKNTKKTNQVLTSKEMKKYSLRELTKFHDSLEFSNGNQARLHGFYGQKCTNCGGYRTKLKNNENDVVYCLKCRDLKNIKFMKREYFIICNRCRYIISEDEIKNKCPYCSLPIKLPISK